MVPQFIFLLSPPQKLAQNLAHQKIWRTLNIFLFDGFTSLLSAEPSTETTFIFSLSYFIAPKLTSALCTELIFLVDQTKPGCEFLHQPQSLTKGHASDSPPSMNVHSSNKAMALPFSLEISRRLLGLPLMFGLNWVRWEQDLHFPCGT